MSKKSYTLISSQQQIVSLPVSISLGIDREPQVELREAMAANGITLQSKQIPDPQRDLSYTHQFAFKVLAITCIYVLCERTNIYFPTSTAAHPSDKVLVVLTAPPRYPDHKAYFPVGVDGREWEFGMIPVLQDEAYSMKAPLNKNMFHTDFDSLVKYFEGGLVASFRAAGFIP